MSISMRIRNLFFIILICLGIAGIFYKLDIAKLKQQVVLSQHQSKSLLQEHNNLLHRQDMLEELVGQFSTVENGLNEWQKKFIKARDLKKLIIEIKAIGRANKLLFRSFNSADEVKENKYLKKPFHIVVVGHYSTTANFISQIAKLPWIVIVGDFTVTQLIQPDLMQTEMELDVYYLDKKLKK